jgi:hypothetical protein
MRKPEPYCPCQLAPVAGLGDYDGKGSFAYKPELDTYTKGYSDGDWGRFFAPARMQDSTMTTAGTLAQTLETMALLATTGAGQVAPMAALLQAPTQEQRAYHVWRWIKENIAYALDAPGKEQLRTLNRIWADRTTGVDCDDYAIMAAALLLAMGERPRFRVVRFGKDKPWSHVYVMVGNYAIDPVMHLFNTEAPGVYAWMDYDPQTGTTINPTAQMTSALLAGVAADPEHLKRQLQEAIRTQAPASELRKLRYLLYMARNQAAKLDTLTPWVLRNVADIAADGSFVLKPGVPREGALAGLTAMMAEADGSGLGNLPDTLLPCIGPYKAALLSGTDAQLLAETKLLQSELGKAKRAARQAKRVERKQARATAKQMKTAGRQERKAVRKATKGQPKAERKAARKEARVRTKVATRQAKDAIPRTKTGKFLKSVKTGILKVNPIGVAGRNAYRGLLSINFRGWATRLHRGLLSDQEAAARGIAPDRLARYRMGITRARQVWESLGGNWDKFVSAVNAGKGKRPIFDAKNLNGTGLGAVDPGTAAALTAAASVIAALAPVIALFGGKEAGEPEGMDETAGADGNPVQDLLSLDNLKTMLSPDSSPEARTQAFGETKRQAEQIVRSIAPNVMPAQEPTLDDLDVGLPAEDEAAFKVASTATPPPATASAAAATGDGLTRTALFVGGGILVFGIGYLAYQQSQKIRLSR